MDALRQAGTQICATEKSSLGRSSIRPIKQACMKGRYMPCYDWSLEPKEGKTSIRSTVSMQFDLETNFYACWSLVSEHIPTYSEVLEMPKGIPNGEKCQSLSKYKDGVYLLHFKRAKLVNGCWNKTIPDKYLKKENGEVIAYEKLGNVYQEKGRARSMVDGRCLWDKVSMNWKCSF